MNRLQRLSIRTQLGGDTADGEDEATDVVHFFETYHGLPSIAPTMASMDRTQRNLLPKKSHVTAFPILLSLVRKDILMKWAYLIQKEARLLFDTFSLTRLAAEVMVS